eukprot:TRINITY_DN595_c1_g2_i2.p1 TRINITY_DN595_c1_g2~~TRINITY_DN595_c1_g2_i2.p1  ORF type:complete len:514 (-),score=178.21 TRINITY_DN595_c1_g2_i2:80-1621(-)
MEKKTNWNSEFQIVILAGGTGKQLHRIISLQEIEQHQQLHENTTFTSSSLLLPTPTPTPISTSTSTSTSTSISTPTPIPTPNSSSTPNSTSTSNSSSPSSSCLETSSLLTKSLLPILNRPLLSYQLQFCENVGFSEIIITTNPIAAPYITNYLNESWPHLPTKVLVCPSNIGSAQVLFRIKNHITTDFIVMSGDLIIKQDFLRHMADLHQNQHSMLTLLLSTNLNPTGQPNTSNINQTSTFAGLDREKIVFYADNTDDNGTLKNLVIPKYILTRHQNLSFHNNLADSHFYMFSKRIFTLLENENQKEIHNIQKDLISLIVKKQFQKIKSPIQPQPENSLDYSQSSKQVLTPELVFKMSRSFQSASREKAVHQNTFSCYAYILENIPCYRVNNIQSYVSANREGARGKLGYLPNEPANKSTYIATNALIGNKVQIGTECIIGTGTVIGDNSIIKKSIIGNHCKIGNAVKITNSIIMNYVTIEEGSIIQDSILSNYCLIESKLVKDKQVGFKETL